MMDEERIGVIVDGIVVREGGWKYTNRKHDRGGRTFGGCTMKTYNAWLRHQGLPVLAEAQFEAEAKAAAKDPGHPMRGNVRALYRHEYIERFLPLPKGLREAVIDAGVNSGWPRAARWCQKIVGTAEDGVIGPATLRAARELWKQGAAARRDALTDFSRERMEFCIKLARSKPAQMANLLGWSNRTFGVLKEAQGEAR